MPSDPDPSRAATTSGPPRLLVVAVLALAVLVAAGILARVTHLGPFNDAKPTTNPFKARELYVDPDSHTAQGAAQAASDGDKARAKAFAEMAAVPSGIWLTPERDPLGEVAGTLDTMLAAANARKEMPLLVLYGIPQRDCTGGYSAGGLTAKQYPKWVAQIAAVLGEQQPSVVVLEPDALVATTQCAHPARRLRLLATAVTTLSTAGVNVYIDAGHSDWVAPRRVAKLLQRVGIAKARGFATNVSNYQTDDDEESYAQQIAAALGDSTHWVIDRGRNGNGATSVWCNPRGRALGDLPGYVEDGTGLDAYLWIKPPGESDGECNGGPPAGEFWPRRAWKLAHNAGW